jgi:hypothetical protein
MATHWMLRLDVFTTGTHFVQSREGGIAWLAHFVSTFSNQDNLLLASIIFGSIGNSFNNLSYFFDPPTGPLFQGLSLVAWYRMLMSATRQHDFLELVAFKNPHAFFYLSSFPTFHFLYNMSTIRMILFVYLASRQRWVLSVLIKLVARHIQRVTTGGKSVWHW